MASSDYYIQDNSDIEDRKLEVAKNLFNSADYSGALKLYLDIAKASMSHKIHYEIGRCYYKLDNVLSAEKYFKRSIDLENVKNPSYLFLGNLYYKKQEIGLAIENWIFYYSYKPDDEAVCLNLATSYFSKQMRLQALYYYQKYLKYAKNKNEVHYLEIKKTIDQFKKIAVEFYQKAQKAVNMNDNSTAIQALEYGVKNYPLDFDSNFLLGKLYYEEKKYIQSMIYLKQAFYIDSKSLDVLQLLSVVMTNVGDFTGAFCCLKRLLPLVINNQKEYLNIIQTIKHLEVNFDEASADGHIRLAQQYYDDNNYKFALFEYENAIMINSGLSAAYEPIIQRIKLSVNPEERIIKTCYEKAGTLYSNKEFKQSNKYFTKIMSLTDAESSDYKFAKSRIMNV